MTMMTIEVAVASAKTALAGDDFTDCIDWLTTVQIETARLVATLMPKIHNRQNFDGCADRTNCASQLCCADCNDSAAPPPIATDMAARWKLLVDMRKLMTPPLPVTSYWMDTLDDLVLLVGRINEVRVAEVTCDTLTDFAGVAKSAGHYDISDFLLRTRNAIFVKFNL